MGENVTFLGLREWTLANIGADIPSSAANIPSAIYTALPAGPYRLAPFAASRPFP